MFIYNLNISFLCQVTVCALETIPQRELHIMQINPSEEALERQVGTFHFAAIPVMFYKTFSLHTLLTIH